jgi:hypothetical protein
MTPSFPGAAIEAGPILSLHMINLERDIVKNFDKA